MQIVYETMYILRPDLGEEQVEQAVAKYQNLLKDQGSDNFEIQNRGKRRLAYEIGKHRDGIYIQMNFTGPGSAIAPMERAMRLGEDVIRYLTTKQQVKDSIVVTPEEEAAAEEVAEEAAA